MNNLALTFLKVLFVIHCFGGSAFAQTLAAPIGLRIVISATFPGASNTGVPVGVTLASSGSITTSANGQVIDAKDINGTVTINHNNVTVKRSRIKSSGYQIVKINDGKTGTVFEDCEIDGISGGPEINGSLSMSRCNVHHISGIVPGDNGVYQDNWLHDIRGGSADAHTECFRIQGGQTGNKILNNTLDMTNSTGGTAFIFINAYWDNITSNIFDSNQMIGGSSVGYSVYSTSNAPSGCSGASSCITTGTEFRNNLISKGMYGYVYPAGSPSSTTIKVFSNNLDSVTKTVIQAPSFIRIQ